MDADHPAYWPSYQAHLTATLTQLSTAKVKPEHINTESAAAAARAFAQEAVDSWPAVEPFCCCDADPNRCEVHS